MKQGKIENRAPRIASFHPRFAGVFRRSIFSILVALAVTSALHALDVPQLSGRVNDHAGMLPSDRARRLEQTLEHFEKETGHQIAVLTIASLQGEDLEGFSIRVAESWKIGEKGFDNGAILLVVRDDRKLRLEIGYGLEGVLPDAIASRIIRDVITPRFKAGDYAGGIEAGLDAIMKVTRGEPLPEAARQRGASSERGLPVGIFTLVLLIAMATVIFLSHANSLGKTGIWSAKGRRRSDYWGSGGAFGSGGFGGGGGFSGGGGGFGGGGASGSW